MAQDVYLGAGGVKQLKSCYVGAGGVKEVTQIYIGQGGSPRFVWPPYIYSSGTFGTLCGGSATALNSTSSTHYMTCSFQSSYIRIRQTTRSNLSEAAAAVFTDTLNTAPYDTLSMEFTLETVPTSTNYNVYLYLALYTAKPTEAEDLIGNVFNNEYRFAYSRLNLINASTGSHTLSIDISSRSSSYYVVAYAYGNYMNSNCLFETRINQIYVS